MDFHIFSGDNTASTWSPASIQAMDLSMISNGSTDHRHQCGPLLLNGPPSQPSVVAHSKIITLDSGSRTYQSKLFFVLCLGHPFIVQNQGNHSAGHHVQELSQRASCSLLILLCSGMVPHPPQASLRP